ncbi:outer membrane beta-barrel family protein [Pedobacter xixiisoli]|uniref:Outer membrane receptor proteins, mostly Fe transport n=1 Tax=Pedobacter xixiisoli TaxID=1476464 RepID=A0A286AER3_9SPHI|nr:outer membrane beta-barrel family protein [Pedobacter xixiisoli]SOD20390.1 Outer membrane receptor proteins, mostly Fe transport [Pedobacter xixiisoli]
MNKHLQRILLLAMFCIANVAFVQAQGTVSGKVLSQKDKQPIDYASIAIKKLTADSSVAGATSSNASGAFSVNNIPVGKYRLYVVYLGLKTVNKDFELTAAKPSINFGELLMEDTGVTLKGVEIKGETPPVVVKKDTLEINAATLKVKENSVVEDLLKKVPGVEVSKDGTVTTQGETIKRVRVDGKDFMGNDPLLATRNLPADMVDKIQIIDDMSEQSKFSGVDDGNREKILNIVTKNGVKNKGYVGNSTFGYGTDERHDVNINVNRFDGSQRISLLGQFNNVNKQNFGGGVGGGGGGRGQMFGGAGGGQQQQGITTTGAAGIDFADTFDDGMQFNGSYFFNKTSLFNTGTTNSQSFIGNDVASSFDNTESTTKRLNHRLNFMIDTKLDSATSIRIQPNISYTDNSANSLKEYEQNTVAGKEVGYQRSITGSTAPSISNNLLLRRKFLRRGRTLSLNVNTNINDSDANNFNRNPWTLTRPTGVTTEDLDQLNDNNVNSFSNTARLVYTEPLSKTLSLELNYQNGYAKDNRKRFVYDFNTLTQQYDVVDLDYSNEFENTTLTNSVGFSFNKNEKKYNWNVGVAGQLTNRKNDNLTTGKLLKQEFVNITPSAQFRYNFSNTKRLNIRYDGRTNQPSIDQIQPVRDNTNTRSIPLGNPDLKPSFSNNLRIFYNNFDFASYRTLFLGAFITQTFNDFGNTQRVITDAASDDFGKIENGFINVKGNYNANLFGNLGLPIIKGNKLNLQIDGGVNVSKGTNITAGIENVTKNFGVRNGYKLVSNMDKLDLIAGVSGRWDHGTYTVGQETNFYTISPNIDISYMFPGNIRLQTDVTYNSLTGRGTANADYTQVNAYISRQFFKNKGTFKLSVNDLFNENTGVLRTATANEIVDKNFNVLKRYFMFSFTYSLSTIAGMSPQQQQGRGPGNFRMGGPGRM